MKRRYRQSVVVVVMALLLMALHTLLHTHTFSFVILPVAAATILAYTISSSAVALLSLIVVSELFSAFPPGVMTAIVLTPYAIRKLFANLEVGITGVFYLLIAGTVAMQLLILTVVNSLLLAWELSLTLSQMWHTVPIQPLLVSFSLTSLLVYSLIILWHELLLSGPAIRPTRLLQRL